MPTIWQNDHSKLLFHDACFKENEGRVGFTEVDQSALNDDDECSSCGGNFLLEMSDEVEEDEEDEAVDDEEDEE